MSRGPFQFLGGCNHISVTADARVVGFCIQVGYIKFLARMINHPYKGRC